MDDEQQNHKSQSVLVPRILIEQTVGLLNEVMFQHGDEDNIAAYIRALGVYVANSRETVP